MAHDPQSGGPALVGRLEALLGVDAVQSDAQSRHFYSSDVFWQPGIEPLAIVSPGDVGQLAATIREAAGANVAIVPRGAGLSYTKGSLPARLGSIVVDLRRFNRVLEVNVDDRYVTVEAGCTWAQLSESLEGTGLRPGYWGPLSGLKATIGGGLSQNSAFFGSAMHGVDADTVLGVTVVLADGSVVTTGSGGRVDTLPFTREGGPDLTGMFLGDNGAFGVKVSATLRLLPRPAEIAFASFGFRTLREMALVQVDLARARLISEGFGIDRAKAEQSGSVNRVVDGARALSDVVMAGKSLVSGLKDAAQMAAEGTGFLKEHAYSLHVVIERDSPAELQAALAAVHGIAGRDGVEIPNTAPKLMRARPFGPLRGMLGLNGERWVPTNALFPLSATETVVDRTQNYLKSREAFMRQHGILPSIMVMTCGSEFFIAPAFYWMDEITPLHVATLGEALVRPWRNRPADPVARAAVAELRRGCQDLFASLGGIGWQVGRDCPYRTTLKPETWAMLVAMKKALDPQGVMNPGALGLDF